MNIMPFSFMKKRKAASVMNLRSEDSLASSLPSKKFASSPTLLSSPSARYLHHNLLLNANAYLLLDKIVFRKGDALDYIVSHCQQMYCDEVIKCVMDIEAFRDILQTREEDLLTMAKRISKQFLTKGAKEEVNLNEGVVQAIEDLILSGKVTRDCFDDALLELRQLLMPHLLQIKNDNKIDMVNLLLADGILKEL